MSNNLDPRQLFIDESGDSERTLLLCALSLPESTVVAARATTNELVDGMAALLPGFAQQPELKANRLAGHSCRTRSLASAIRLRSTPMSASLSIGIRSSIWPA
jgi:hypothetical protein